MYKYVHAYIHTQTNSFKHSYRHQKLSSHEINLPIRTNLKVCPNQNYSTETERDFFLNRGIRTWLKKRRKKGQTQNKIRKKRTDFMTTLLVVPVWIIIKSDNLIIMFSLSSLSKYIADRIVQRHRFLRGLVRICASVT